MCEPTTIAMMALSGGQTALGIMGSNRALAARNRNRAKLYEYDKLRIHANHMTNITSYYLRGVDAELEWDDASIKASNAIDAQQVVINKAIADSLRTSEGDYVKMISDPRVAKSLERSGISARRIKTAFKGAAGRAKARRAGEIDDARDKAAIALAEIDQLRAKTIRDSNTKIGMAPIRAADPPKPVFEKAPSLFSSLTKVALSVAQGYIAGGGKFGAGETGKITNKALEQSNVNAFTTASTEGWTPLGNYGDFASSNSVAFSNTSNQLGVGWNYQGPISNASGVNMADYNITNLPTGVWSQ